MQIIEYRHLSDELHFSGAAVALGFFDGVHAAHRELLRLLVREAEENRLTPCVATFTENIANSKKLQALLYNTEDKLRIFEELGVKVVFLIDFDSIASLTAEEFVGEVLVGALGARVAISGYNFRFGVGASAGIEELSSLMKRNGGRAIILKEQTALGEPISATRIRRLISEKKLSEAAELLGCPYFISGVVERGLGLGKEYGFPTANVPVRESSPITVGVYRTAVKIGEKLYTGVTNVGTCPTVAQRELHTETLISDFCGELYGEELRIYFLGYLRAERQFSSVEELRRQIKADEKKAIKENGDLKWLETGLSLR